MLNPDTDSAEAARPSKRFRDYIVEKAGDRKTQIFIINAVFRNDEIVDKLPDIYQSPKYQECFENQRFCTEESGLKNTSIHTDTRPQKGWDFALNVGFSHCNGWKNNDNVIILNKIQYPFKDAIYTTLFGRHPAISFNMLNRESEFWLSNHWLKIYCDVLDEPAASNYTPILNSINTKKAETNDKTARYACIVPPDFAKKEAYQDFFNAFCNSGIHVIVCPSPVAAT
jgi:hypothetical protein